MLYIMYLGPECGQEVKVHLEVSGQDGLDDEEPESLHLGSLHRHQEVVLCKVGKEVPTGSSMVVLQH